MVVGSVVELAIAPPPSQQQNTLANILLVFFCHFGIRLGSFLFGVIVDYYCSASGYPIYIHCYPVARRCFCFCSFCLADSPLLFLLSGLSVP